MTKLWAVSGFALLVSTSLANATNEASGAGPEGLQSSNADTSIVLRKPGEKPLPRIEATPRNQQRWSSRIGRSYPAMSLFLEQDGMVGFVARVNVGGRADDCRVTLSSGYSLLDRRTCQSIVRYARFERELDQDGNPVETRYTNSVVWQIAGDSEGIFSFDDLGLTYPAKALEEGLEGQTQIEIVVGVDERVISCKVLASSGYPMLDDETCKGVIVLDGGKRVDGSYRGDEKRTLVRSIQWEVPEEEDENDDY
ncbi:TonB family protein [Erythrobacter longus]|uniref:TonB family protein n=1 Tax=Erythrobacter longus TaxID=1044 RepID=UPI00137677F3|nr:TonB family protein [Erythrobacter longus]